MKIAVQTGGATRHFGLEGAIYAFKKAGFKSIDWNVPTGIDLKKILPMSFSQ